MITTSTGTSSVTGSQSIGNNLVVSGYANVVGSIQAGGGAAIGGVLTVSANGFIGGQTNAIGAARFANTLTVVGATTLSNTSAHTGAATFSNTVAVTGVLTISNTVTGAIIPTSTGTQLGNTTNRYEVTANTLTVNSTATFSGNTIPSSNGVVLGNNTSRWAVSGTTADFSGAVNLQSTLVVASSVDANTFIDIGPATTITSNTIAYSNAVPGQTVIDTFSSSTYRTTKYLIEVKNATTGYMSEELLLTHDGTTVFITEYAVVNTVATFCTFDVDINAGSVRLLATPTTNATFKLARTMIV